MESKLLQRPIRQDPVERPSIQMLRGPRKQQQPYKIDDAEALLVDTDREAVVSQFHMEPAENELHIQR
jgi:hypothetical protein